MMDAAISTGQRAPSEQDRIREFARRLAAQAPPLTSMQRARIVALLRTPTARPDVAGGAA